MAFQCSSGLQNNFINVINDSIPETIAPTQSQEDQCNRLQNLGPSLERSLVLLDMTSDETGQ